MFLKAQIKKKNCENLKKIPIASISILNNFQKCQNTLN
jgi:hypothetical protein